MSDDSGDFLCGMPATVRRPMAFGKRSIDASDLCLLHGEDATEVARELRRDTALSRFVRKAFGFDPKELAALPRRGRPRKDDEHTRDLLVFEALRRVGEKTEEAYELTAAIRSAEGRCGKDGNAITADAIKSAVSRRRRARKLGDLFLPAISDEEIERLRSKSK